MDKQTVKAGYEQARKEIETQEVAHVKEMVLATLRRIEELKAGIRDIKAEKERLMQEHDSAIAESEKTIKLLRMDIEDLKNGKLERIEERQAVDKKAAEAAVIIVKRVTEPVYVPVPYPMTQPQPYSPFNPSPSGPIVWCGQINPTYSNCMTVNTQENGWTELSCVASLSTAVSGAYDVGTSIVHIR